MSHKPFDRETFIERLEFYRGCPYWEDACDERDAVVAVWDELERRHDSVVEMLGKACELIGATSDILGLIEAWRSRGKYEDAMALLEALGRPISSLSSVSESTPT